jgi:GTP cyclohydrolase I
MALPPHKFVATVKAIRDLLIALGEDPDRSGLKDTPMRVAKMYSRVLDGNYAEVPEATAFEGEEYDGQIIVHHVPFYAFCEHHLALFRGHFGLAIVPDKKIIGLSKFVRLFRHNCKRPTIQERLTQEAVEILMKSSRAKGAACYVTAEHTCMSTRGVQAHGARTTTIAHAGIYSDNLELREQFLAEARTPISS